MHLVQRCPGAVGYGLSAEIVTISDHGGERHACDHGWKPSGSRRASARTARYCSALIAPSFLSFDCAVSATEKPCRNRSTMHSCCSGFSCLTAESRVTLVM